MKAFEAKYGAVSSYGPLAYEAANILLEAIKTCRQGGSRRGPRCRARHQGLQGHARHADQPSTTRATSPTPTLSVYQVKGKGFELVKTVSK